MNNLNKEIINCDVAVIGGGFAGVCAAISSARNGAKTVLIHNRPVLGGNASSEIHVPSSGASHMGERKNVREGGIIEEIFLENLYTNSNNSPYIFDMILWSKANFQENLSLYLNTTVTSVELDNNTIKSVNAIGIMNETVYKVNSKIFIDCTGDGTVAYLAGADYLTGREAISDYNEKGAVEKSDNMTMGNSLLIKWEDTGHPVKYIKPVWAYDFKDKDLGDLTADDEGYWWVELGGTELDIIKDFNQIETELKRIVAGIWDYIKNSGKFNSENYDLRWVSTVAGKRESRRFVGDYILTENDIINCTQFDDAIAYSGWHIDSHQPEKFYSMMRELEGLPENITGDKTYYIEDIYQIPYRCIYSHNIDNLMFAGRNISVTHRALASSRVMLTCAILGQAAGTASAFSVKNDITPKIAGEKFIKKIQQQLLKDDCYIPFIKNNDQKDLAKKSTVICSSYTNSNNCENIINGVSRKVYENSNCWESETITSEQWVSLNLSKQSSLNQLRLYFDSDYSLEIYPTQSKWHLKKIVTTQVPSTLVKEFTVTLFNNNEEVFKETVKKNYQRVFIKNFNKIKCDKIKITVTKTHGYDKARIFEVRAY